MLRPWPREVVLSFEVAARSALLIRSALLLYSEEAFRSGAQALTLDEFTAKWKVSLAD